MATAEKKTSKVEEAEIFLHEVLAKGPVPAKEVNDLATAQGISVATLRRASDQLEVVKAKAGMDGGWIWSLPSSPGAAVAKAFKPAEPENLSTLSTLQDAQVVAVSPLDDEDAQIISAPEGLRNFGEAELDVGWLDPGGLFDEEAMREAGWRKVDGDWWVFPPSATA
jgi:hypothetical protein